MRSITNVIDIHIHIQSNTNTGWLCCFRYERFIDFLTSVHGKTRRETQFLKVYANHTRLTILYWRAVHLVMFKISVGTNPKNPSTCFNGRELNSLPQWSNLNFSTDSFQNPQILRTISSRHDVIHTLAPFSFWGFIMSMVIVISFAHDHKLCTWALDPNCSKPKQTECWNIIKEKWLI